MSTLPSHEAILLEVHQSLGGRKYQTTKKRKFVTAQASLSAHETMGTEILQDVFHALDMTPEAQMSALDNFESFTHAYKTVELNTWTFAADPRQVLWMLSGYFYMPGLARHVAFWSLDQTLDKGMPRGRFWYLPEQREVAGKPELYLPVAQTVDWLLDLLGMPVEEFADECSEADENYEGLRRSLYNWRKGTTLQSRTTNKYFSDDAELDFKGTFQVNENDTPTEQFTSALEFVNRKRLTADMLRLEIPITQPGCLEAILDSKTDEDVQMTFVECLAERYARPSNKTIRLRLLLARAVQDGYVRLLKVLCPGVDKLCADPEKNKLLQLINIYKLIYNLTVDAYRNCEGQGEFAENAWFEAHLPSLDKEGLFLSILPSRYGTSNLELARILTRRFLEMQPGEELEDHIGYDEQSMLSTIQRNADRIETAIDELRSELALVERMKRSSAWRTLQGEHRYWVVSQVAHHKDLRPREKKAAIQRLRDLASTPAEIIRAILIELHVYLNDESRTRTKDTRSKVQALLDEAESNEGYALWRAAILQYKAKHLLACNDFAGAGSSFREALEASRERNYGPLRGEVARDCFAVELANQKLIINNQEKYYREMLAGGILGENNHIPPIEEVARSIFDYFWSSLYRPYRGVQTLKPRSMKIGKKIIHELIGLFSAFDNESSQEWIKANHQLLKSYLPDVEGNSVLMLLTKMLLSSQKALSSTQHIIPSELMSDHRRVEDMLEHWRQFIGQLAEMAPQQLDIRDLKGQTPLMLMAEVGDTELVQALLKAGADPDFQDWHGTTALHSAVKSHVNSCVDALLDHPCNLAKITRDGRSPLHTASWAANMHAVQRLLQLAPELAWQRDEQGMTPLELVEFLIDDPTAREELAAQLAQNGRRPATEQDMMDVVQLLEQAILVQ